MSSKSIAQIMKENDDLLSMIEKAENELKIKKEQEKLRRRKRRKKTCQVLTLNHDIRKLRESLDKLEATHSALGSPKAWTLQQLYDLEYDMAYTSYLANIAGFPPTCTLYLPPDKTGPKAEQRRNSLFEDLMKGINACLDDHV